MNIVNLSSETNAASLGRVSTQKGTTSCKGVVNTVKNIENGLHTWQRAIYMH